MKQIRWMHSIWMIIILGLNFGICYGQKPLQKPQRSANQQKIEQKRRPTPKKLTGTIAGHDYVDLGLSVKWATCNVGAEKKELGGDYYSWGAVNSHNSFEIKNCANYGKDARSIMAWNGADIVAKRWGNKWRLPTSSEIKELIAKCSWTPMTVNGCNGYLVKGKNGQSIFLPCSGFKSGTDLIYHNYWGFYWSSIPYGIHSAYALFINGVSVGKQYSIEALGARLCLGDRSIGRCIRPVVE